MSTLTPGLRALLRTSTSIRPAASQVSRPLSHFQSQSPSPPPPYHARNITILASQTAWTRFQTPYSYSSVRTFTRTTRARHSSSSSAPSSSSEAAATIDETIEQIQELYGTARDEFEIAVEETEKNTTYAADDRAAAREELDKLLEYYTGVVEGGDAAVAEEVKRRVGQRIRELEQAVLALEESVTHGD